MGINRWNEREEKRMKANDPDASPHVTEDRKGDASSRLDESEEPAESEEKRRVAEKLREREEGS